MNYTIAAAPWFNPVTVLDHCQRQYDDRYRAHDAVHTLRNHFHVSYGIAKGILDGSIPTKADSATGDIHFTVTKHERP